MMTSLGLREIHPDAFLLDLIVNDRAAVRAAVDAPLSKGQAMGGDLTQDTRAEEVAFAARGARFAMT